MLSNKPQTSTAMDTITDQINSNIVPGPYLNSPSRVVTSLHSARSKPPGTWSAAESPHSHPTHPPQPDCVRDQIRFFSSQSVVKLFALVSVLDFERFKWRLKSSLHFSLFSNLFFPRRPGRIDVHCRRPFLLWVALFCHLSNSLALFP